MQARRDDLAEKDASNRSPFLDCDYCLENLSEAERARMGCAWMPESERRPGPRAFPELDECPGYAIRLPEVYEAARAYQWREKGQLQLLYDEPLTGVLRDAVDILGHAVGKQQSEDLQRKSEAVKRGSH